MSSAAILSLKILTDAADNKDKYIMLTKIGADRKMINKSMRMQCIMYFGLPLAVAIIHSIFGIQTGVKILTFFGKKGLVNAIILTSVIIVAVYGGYAALTYLCSKKICNTNE